jgi:type II secretory pathway component PulM
MKQLSSRDQALAVLGGVGLIVLVLFLVVAMPLRSQGAKLERQAQALQKQITEAEKAYREVPTLKEQIKTAETQLGTLTRSKTNPIPDVVREVNKLTKELKVRVTSTRPSEPEYAETYVKYATTFEVQAAFEDLVRLLYELEQPPHNLWVDGAELDRDDRTGQLRATITVSVYTRRPASKADHAKS